ncbi:hypothetical protein BX666DRAFT_1898694 [Dichotomocladium elegans]|nr:hypothetical protein BX666DRAFT_1898694 [Dichotomocladium elegans]
MAGQRASRAFQQRASQFIKVQRGPKWKRELVPDHKFAYIDVDEFRKATCYNGFRYVLLFISIIISAATYIADLWSMCILLIYEQWSLSTEPMIPLKISKWIYVACIALSFLLLAWDIYKCRNVLDTDDISLAVTNPMAYHYNSVKSFSRFCLFRKINDSRKTSDMAAFYVFYTLKGWKKLLFAQSPRQIIAAFTVAALLKTAWTKKGTFHIDDDWDAYGDDWQQRVALILMSFTCLIWAISMIELMIACVLYIFVFCQIQGNLKEYCCHKIDKRISELIEKQKRKRIREQEKKMAKANKKNPILSEESVTPSTLVEEEFYDDTRPLKSAAGPPYRGEEMRPGFPDRAYTDPSYFYNNHYQHQQPDQQAYYDEASTYYEMQQYPASPYQQPMHSQQQQRPFHRPSPQHWASAPVVSPAPAAAVATTAAVTPSIAPHLPYAPRTSPQPQYRQVSPSLARQQVSPVPAHRAAAGPASQNNHYF